mmetsp:Transcript_14575/g.20599  ORF Transcript_14575/g.20599 Transcript_14575/m.20599 type:complete len:444 (+) Transcript_14575:106-1437(+)
MPVRPVKKAGSSGPADDSVRSNGSGPRKELEWSLRSLRNVDTGAQHFMNNYYDSSDDSDDEDKTPTLVDQSAYEIFKGKETKNDMNGEGRKDVWATLNAPLRTGVVDGRKVVFELLNNVTQKPATSRKERLKRSHEVVNSDQSNWEVRIRFWCLHFKVSTLSLMFFVTLIALNAAFAGLFYIHDERCCGDEEFSYADVFNFCVQTSTTIGYGTYSPVGHYSNFLVFILSYVAMLINTLFAGLLYTKFVTPAINIQFSDVMTICNVNGVPCLSFRLGNADGSNLNPLTDINVRLTYSYQIPYTDHKGDSNFFRQTEELRLLSNRQHGLKEVWLLRHVLDESSPLFGLNFKEHPGDKIYVFTLSIDAVQDLTKSSVNIQTEYALEDILIGHQFVPLESMDETSRTVSEDYSKLSDTEPYPVWYPAKAADYAKDNDALYSYKPGSV